MSGPDFRMAPLALRDPMRVVRPRATVSGKARGTAMPQLLGRDAVIARIAAAVERARVAGAGTVTVTGPAGVGTTAVVEEALRPWGSRVSRASGALPPDEEARFWWIDDVQRMPEAEVERLRAGDGAARVVVLSGRRPLGARLAALAGRAMRADPAAAVDVEALDGADAVVAVAALASTPSELGTVATESALRLATLTGSRLRLLAAVLIAEEAITGTAVRVAVDDLLVDASAPARCLLEILAIGGPATRVAAAELVWAQDPHAASFDTVAGELVDAGLVARQPGTLTIAVPIIAQSLAQRLGAHREAELRVLFAEALAGLESVDPREIAPHVRPVADRLPVSFSVDVLVAAADRSVAASEHLAAAEDLEIAADLLERAPAALRERARLFDILRALAGARYLEGDVPAADAANRRALELRDAVPEERVVEAELMHAYSRSDRGDPSEVPPASPADRNDVEGLVMRLFLTDRGDDVEDLDAICAHLVACDGPSASSVQRGAAALGRSIRASVAGDLEVARSEAERSLAIAGDESPSLYGATQRELVRLSVFAGDLFAALRYNEGPTYSVEGRVPRFIEAAALVQHASLLVLQGEIGAAAEEADRALGMSRLTPVPRGIVRCVSWAALLSAMTGDLDRAALLVAEASRLLTKGGNLRLDAVVDLARAQIALRDSGRVPKCDLRLERVEGPARLLLPTLLARLALAHADEATVARSLAELDRLAPSPPAGALAQRVRALQLLPTKRRREAVDALGESSERLDELGFATLAAETRLEWAELAAERGQADPREVVVELISHFDARRLDDWGDRARRLARTLGVRVGARRGGTGDLTRREGEVVDLVLEGLSNADVARRLYLSERTVETHLQHVYRRLGIDSRIALVARFGARPNGRADDE